MWDESSHQLLGFDQEARADTAHRGMMEIEADTAKELPCSKRGGGGGGLGSGAVRRERGSRRNGNDERGQVTERRNKRKRGCATREIQRRA